MLTAEGRQTDRAVLLRVAFGPDAQQRRVQQAEPARQDPLAARPLASEVSRDPAAHGGQSLGEFERAVELPRGHSARPVGMVEILRAARVVHPDGLKVTVGARADPHVPPRRRDRERADPRERLLVADARAARVAILEAPPPADPGDARIARAGTA
ncbi:hypothetical protein GCM10010910_27050 [Microbacterium nanhaiense]|uniref:Uncharacterized protein n=1 Tax=Microbacterium nanhaiense TaxID=1301026 RepID=A0ABQ2N363_9MICO|nr:hypothetical protein GCM10010910_27050 [Microbacterium nanhaiense]